MRAAEVVMAVQREYDETKTEYTSLLSEQKAGISRVPNHGYEASPALGPAGPEIDFGLALRREDLFDQGRLCLGFLLEYMMILQYFS